MGSGVDGAEKLVNGVPVEGALPAPLEFREKLLEVIPAGVYTCDADGRITSYNRAAAELWGRAPEIGESEERFCGSHRLYWPDGTPLPHARTPMAIALREGRSFRDAEVIVERPDGRRITALVNIAVRKDEAGRVTGAVNCFIDITDRKRAEAELRQRTEAYYRLLEHLPAGAYTCDADGLITYYNQRAVEIWGREPELHAPEDRFCGSFKLFHPDGQPMRHDRCWMALALGREEDYSDQEVCIERPDGSRVTALAHAHPLHDEHGRLIGAVNVLVDITQRKRDREALVEADRRKDEFLAMLSHELRNPLAPIRNAVELLGEERGDAAGRKKALDALDRQVGTLTRLVEDLLDVSRVTTGTIRLRDEDLDLVDVLRETVDSIRPLFEERRQRLAVSLPEGPMRVRGDAMRLEQVVVNLLGNASKYTPEGGRISLEAWPEAGDGERPEVVVRVQDDGVGMEPELLAGGFELFRKGEDRDDSQNGLGLGLSLVKRLTEKHGGSVAAFSEGPGRGSEFTVRLPLAEGRASAPERRADADAPPVTVADAPATADPDEEAPSADGTRVLVVDDNRDAARMLVSLLRLRGYRVRAAHDGRSALRLAADFEPAVVLLDIGMPEMDGYEVARRLRNGDRPDAQPLLVAMTGYGQSEDKRRSREAGFDHHLVKPTDFAELRTILESAST